MLRSTAEIPTNYKVCFRATQEAIAAFAVLQAEFISQPEISLTQYEELGSVVSHSSARHSEIGKRYTEAEYNILDILELATFCLGLENGCFKETIST